jgi:glycosyltransferase involved in cell wall biosynthesis
MSLEKPRVSVLLPCYNAADTLEEALDSLRRQTFSDFEIVAVDDGSQDATPVILQGWAKEDRRFHLLFQAHSGIVPALNAGLAACRAPYVARMDADDRAHPERLARQVSFLDAHPEISVVGCQVEGFPAGQVREGFRIYMDWQNRLLSDEDIRREIFVESPLAHPSVVFRREAVAQAGDYQDAGWAEDYDLWLRLYLRGAKFAKIARPLLYWRERPQRLTRCDPRYSLENFLRLKAHYLIRGPLSGRDALVIWGAGMVGRRLSKHLLRSGAPLVAFIDIDPRKIGNLRGGKPILAPQELSSLWQRFKNPLLLSAVGSRGARQLIRERLEGMGLREGQDWLGAA